MYSLFTIYLFIYLSTYYLLFNIYLFIYYRARRDIYTYTRGPTQHLKLSA